MALGLLLLVCAPAAFFSWNGRTAQARSGNVSGNHNDATLLLAKATGMTNSDEARMLLKALEDGTLDYDAVSSALEEDAARKAAKIKAEIEAEANRKAAEEKATAERAAAERAAAEKKAAENAAAEKKAAEKAAAEKAAAKMTSFKMREMDPQSRIDAFFDNGDDNEEDDWLQRDFEDEIDEGAESVSIPRGELTRSINYENRRVGRVP